MTRSRTRRVRKARPCCGAARFHVPFHHKHFHRCTLTLSAYFSVSPTAVLVGGPSRTGGRKIIFTPKRATCVIFSVLPSSSGSFSFAASNQPKTPPNSLRLSFRPDPPPPPTPTRSNIPRFVLLSCDGCSLLCFLLQRAFSLSLSPCPSLLLLKCVISPSHHHRASKTAHRQTFFLFFFF